jgi:hypothetical protein
MHFLVSHIIFDVATTTAVDHRALSSLCEKLTKRFGVLAKPYHSLEKDGNASIAIAALANKQEALGRIADDVADFCEKAGFGRVDEEFTLLDDFESLEDYEEA